MYPPIRRLSVLAAWCLATSATAVLAQAPEHGTWTTFTPSSPTPANRVEHTAVLDPIEARMLVYGGNAVGGGNLNDAWAFDLVSNTWTPVAFSGGPPPAVRSALGAFDVHRNQVVIVTGVDDGSPSQTWGLLQPFSWTQFENLSPGRLLPCVVYDSKRDRIILHGGLGAPSDVWAFSLANETWSPLFPAGPTPTARWAHVGIYDPIDDRVIVFSGRDGLANDVWSLTLAGTPSWTRLDPTGSAPSGRGHVAAAYDPERHRMILHGGWNGGRLNDTWALDLNGHPSWQLLAPGGTSPPVNSHRSAVYDRDRSRVVIFGGFDPSPSQGQVWCLNFAPAVPRYSMAVQAAGEGTVTRAPDQSLYESGDFVRLTAIPSLGWEFTGWSGDATGNANPLDIMVERDLSITASFAPGEHELEIEVSGAGTVTKAPDHPHYSFGDEVVLTAHASPGWSFVGWSGDATGEDTTVTVTMTADRTVLATFQDLDHPTAIVHYPNGGEVLVTGSDYKLAWEAADGLGLASVELALSRDHGATWEVLAENAMNSSSIVWSVSRPGANTSGAPIHSAFLRVTARDINGNTTVDQSDAPFAIYDLVPDHLLNVEAIGRGSVNRSHDTTRYEHGAQVTLTAVPEPDWEFLGWSGDTTDAANPIELVMNHNLSITANFRDARSPEITLIYPNGGQILIPGSRYKLAWSATDQVGVAFVTISISRDSGETWRPIASMIPNTGTHVWTASRPGGNEGSSPVFACLLRMAAHDSAGNVGMDDSETPFAIHDLAPLGVEPAAAGAFILRSVEPNPTAGFVRIRYDVPEPSPIRLSIHDLQGRQVVVLEDGIRESGSHYSEWATGSGGGEVGSGVYFVRLRTPRGTISRRLLVTR